MSASYGQCSVTGATIRGVEAVPVDVEVVVTSGLPGMSIVGLPDTAVQEARERVKAAIRASGFSVPSEKVVVNLAPSGLRKSGSGLDLPVAVGILVATGQLDPALLSNRLYVGELSLDGSIRSVAGILAYGICAHRLGIELVCAPESDAVPIERLGQMALPNLSRLRCNDLDPIRRKPAHPARKIPDFADIAGHDVAKRALQIAAAGNHGLFMMGPPGSGKTMLASRLPSILPPLSEAESLETAVIHSVAGEATVDDILDRRRPFRAPHHSISLAGLVGGGSQPIYPGEISLAHHGVLFLDELSEFKGHVLQGIRQPMETGSVCITRADGHMVFPARFMLVAASNPCPCGFCGDSDIPCTCTVPQIRKYQSRIGGPLMDRIDIHIDIGRMPPDSVMKTGNGTGSETLRDGVLKAREFARWRRAKQQGGAKAGVPEGSFGDVKPSSLAGKTPMEIVRTCGLDESDKRFLASMAETYAMSGRGIIRTLGVARTIADMDEQLSVSRGHLAEALGFRLKEGIGGS